MLHADPDPSDSSSSGVAIIGLAGRFPGAEDVEEFWANLLAARETIRFFKPEDLAPGEPSNLAEYVPCRGVLDQAEWIDAGFFGMNRLEAEVTDPQQRVFLEVAWTALEHAGYDPHRLPGPCGVWAGSGNNHYYQHQLAGNTTLLDTAGPEAVMIGNEKDYLATRVAYRLNLRGPAVTVVTACSTSLVAVAQAAQALLTYQCDLALAGGASIRWPQNRGYIHEEGSIFSPDGHCRAFDERSAGTVFSSGAGCVVLKRLDEAVRDGDTIYAVIKGAALNNDGAGKMSFAAPSVDGQAENIALAMALADTTPEAIDFVEAHGTGTALGDVIEVAALTQAFRGGGDTSVGRCLLGSLKPATGHMDAAAGIGGLIKTALALHHRIVPGTVHFTRPNPRLGLSESPFRLSADAVALPPERRPHRALVAALGIGGTNAHVVVESAPAVKTAILSSASGDPVPLVLSARTPMALAAMQDRLASFLETAKSAPLRDVAFTLARGRAVLNCRCVVVAQSAEQAAAALRSLPATAAATPSPLPVALMFPGQGSQHAGMGRDLMRRFPVFRSEMERCQGLLGFNPLAGTDEELAATARAQLALFSMGYALARQYEAWGITAEALIGHSIGEYVAATLAGVFSLADALRLVTARGHAMQAQPAGAMLAVRAPESDLDLPAGLDLAALNAPQACVVSGNTDAILDYEAACATRGLGTKRLRTSHAFHSRLMDGALADFRRAFDDITLHPLRRRVVSNVTGTDLTDAEATSPDYWVRHLRSPVRFAEGVDNLKAGHLLLEVGPAHTLTHLARQAGATAVASLPRPHDPNPEESASVLRALGELWTLGTPIDWIAVFPDGTGRRIALPTYPFERRRFCPEVAATAPSAYPASENAIDPTLASLPTAPPPGLPAGLQPVFSTDSSLAPLPTSSDDPASPSPSPSPASSAPHSRYDVLLAELANQLLRISGVDVASHPPTTAFLRLGFDSLFLTQAAIVLKKHFGVRISFRQLMEELTSLDALARHLDAHLPPGLFEQAAATAAPAPPREESAPPTLPVSSDLDSRLARIEAGLARLTGGAPQAPAAPPQLHEKSLREKPAAFGPFKPVDTRPGGSLSDHQRTHLDGLISDYCSRYPKSKEYTARHRGHFADPRTVAGFNPLWKEMVFPVVTNRSEGAYLWDIDGNQWIDVVHGFGSALFGHRPPFVVDALQAQLDRGFEIGPTHELAGELAQRLAGHSGQDRVAFANTGSEAVMAAIRVARTVTGRDRIVMFTGAYHGIFDEVLARASVVAGDLRAIPITPGIPNSSQAEVLVLEYGDPESLEIIRRHGHELAAVLVEPVPSRRPEIAPVAFVQELRRLTALSETALVFDEIVLGGRTGLPGAQKHFGIEADMVTYGKVLGGGLPLGVLAGKRRFMDALDGGTWNYGDSSVPEAGVTFFAGTFIRHPLALAACRAVLDRLEAEGPALQQALDDRTRRFVDALNTQFTSANVPITVTRFGSLWMLHADPEPPHFSLLFYHLRLRGIHIWEGRGNFLSTAHTDTHCAAILAAFADSVRALQKGGLFPGGQENASLTTPNTASAIAPGVPAAAHHRDPQGSVSLPTPPASADQENLPLTPEQQELFLATQLSPEASVAAHESVTINLQGPLDRPRLERAIQWLAARHDALRVSFAADGSHQRVSPVGIAPSLVTVAPDTLEEASARQFLEPFDLTTAPLWRTALISRSDHDHALVITAHHLVCDGWSFGVIVHELPRLYRGESLPSATRLRQVTDLPRDPAAAAYWRAQFASPPTPVELPADRPRPTFSDLAAHTLRGTLEADLAARLPEFCQRIQATPNVVLLAAWQLLLHRLTGSRDVVVGTPIAGQAATGLPHLVTHLVHFLPLRLAFDEDMTASDLVARTRRQLADATDHQDYTLGQLFQDLALPRQAGRPSFVTTTFTCQNDAGIEDWGDGLESRMQLNPKRRLAFDASLFVTIEGTDVRWQLVYQQCLFESSTVAHWIRCFENLIRVMMEAPESRVDHLDLLPPQDARLLHHTWNHLDQPAPPSLGIHQCFENQAARTPQAEALVWDHGSWSYAELNARANHFARELLAAGLPNDSVVALVAERSPQTVAAMLGILKAGGSYAPLDPGLPEQRLHSLISELCPAMVACEGEQRNRLRSHRFEPPITFIDIPATERPPQFEECRNPDVPVHPTSAACLMFTSGSTGRPKAVVVPHRAVVRLVHDQSFASMTAAESWLQLAPLSFDASTLEVFAPLLHGGRLVLMPSGNPSLSDIGTAIRRHHITSLWLTAGLFQLMVDERIEDLQPLRQLLTGGDVVSVPHARRLLERFPHLHLVNGYGPTENTTFTCCHHITAEDLDRPSLPIGRPIAHTSVFIVDQNDQPCPLGVAGELLTGGLGLAQGYWRRPDASAVAFVEHPRFGRVYRTGDRARWRSIGGKEDGPQAVIEFLGRTDTQLKVRGFRIEPAEVEAALVAHPGVKQAVVRARGATAGHRRLVAWCVPSGAFLPPVNDLRAHLGQHLPDYMIPQEFVPVVGSLPITANGKIDEPALPDALTLASPAAPDSPPTRHPRSQSERRLHRLVAQVLGHDRFGIQDDFFDLGGDSLRGLALFNLIEREFGCSLPLGTLFAAPSVEKLAPLLDHSTEKLPAHVIPIQPRGGQPPLFLIHGGDGGVLFYRNAVARLNPDQPVYGIECPMLTDPSLPDPGPSVTAIAKTYLDLVRQVQPSGPYRLGGYSFGGLVAYEIGLLLLEDGQSIDHLLLFDTANPARPPRYFSPLGRIAARWNIDRDAGLTLPRRLFSLLVRAATGLDGRRRYSAELAAVRKARDVGHRAGENVRPLEVREATMKLMAAYSPPPTAANLTLFRCQDPNDKCEHTPALGWEDVVGGKIETIPVGGTHLHVFEPPHVHALAERLADCLERPRVPVRHVVANLVPA
jgi:amino acid adenylation domain-containing protein